MSLLPPGLHAQPTTYFHSVVGLPGHLLGTAIIFTAFFTLCWLVTLLLHALHAIPRFPDEILTLITTIELYVVYADVSLCLVVLFAGTYRFCKNLYAR